MKLTPCILLRKVASATLVFVAIASAFLMQRSAPQPEIQGNLSPRDVSDVSGIVRTAMKEPLLPNLSWDSFSSLPDALRQRWSERIISIHAGTSETIKVTTGIDDGLLPRTQYYLQKTTNGWGIAHVVATGGYVAQ